MLKKKEIILFVTMIILCIITIVLLRQFKKDGSIVRVTVGSIVYGTYLLSEDQTIAVDTPYGYNTVVIEDGVVSCIDASCPDHICVLTPAITKEDHLIPIICIPNGMAVEIVTEEELEE